MAVKNGIPDAALGAQYAFEDKTVTLPDGHVMHYVEAGRAGLRRPTLLLVHGHPTWSFLYREIVRPLARVARVIAVDHVGYGRSDHPTDPAYHSLERHIENLGHFVEALRLKRVVPVLHGMGGPVGLGWAMRHQDRLAGLVVLNTGAFPERAPVKHSRLLGVMARPRLARLLHARRNPSVELLLPRGTLRELPDAVMDGYRHPFPSRSSRAALVAGPRMLTDGAGLATLREVEQGLAGLDVPACIVWGVDDPVFTRRQAEAFRQALPRAEAPVYLEAGHFLQEDAPAELAAQIERFLRA